MNYVLFDVKLTPFSIAIQSKFFSKEIAGKIVSPKMNGEKQKGDK